MTVRPSVVGSCTSTIWIVQHRPRRQSRCQGSQPLLQGNLQAVGQERDKDVGFNPLIGLVIDRADCEIPLQFLECLLHFDQLQVERPELRRIATCHVRP